MIRNYFNIYLIYFENYFTTATVHFIVSFRTVLDPITEPVTWYAMTVALTLVLHSRARCSQMKQNLLLVCSIPQWKLEPGYNSRCKIRTCKYLSQQQKNLSITFCKASNSNLFTILQFMWLCMVIASTVDNNRLNKQSCVIFFSIFVSNNELLIKTVLIELVNESVSTRRLMKRQTQHNMAEAAEPIWSVSRKVMPEGSPYFGAVFIIIISVMWWDHSRHPSSSLQSPQSFFESHRLVDATHIPMEHWNWFEVHAGNETEINTWAVKVDQGFQLGSLFGWAHVECGVRF